MPSGISVATVSAASELILKPNAIVSQMTASSEAERPVQREHDAGAGRDPFAAAETVEHRIQMADEDGERGGGDRPFGRGERDR